MRVSIHDSTGGTHNVTLWRDSSIVGQFSALTGDTLFVDEGLLPDQPYVYTAVIGGIDTAFVQTVTMPLTSHDFVWETFTFGGDAGSCVFNDVAIINDTLAYAVGAVYIKDTTHVNGSRFYNAAKWNGVDWELMTVWYYWYDDFGKYDSSTSELRCIYAYSPDRIWFGWSNVTFWNGQRFLSAEANLNGLANKMWGAGTANIYIVGTNGAISHYNGFTWTPIASGTSLHFYDIWGDQNKKTGEWEVLAVASNYGESPPGKAIVRIQNNNVIPIDATGTSNFLSNIWFRAGRKYYVCGDAVYETDATNNCTSEPCWSQEVTGWSSLGGIRGNEINDVVVVGINNFA
ncbi:MAG: hypothetical protein WEB33_01420, partial [Bacteroidota bacterium]